MYASIAKCKKKKCEHNEDEYDAEEGKNLSSLGHI